jgi:hypothetical protein
MKGGEVIGAEGELQRRLVSIVVSCGDNPCGKWRTGEDDFSA